MIFRGSNQFDQLTPVVKRLIVVNVVVFLVQMILPVDFVLYLGLTPQLVLTKFWVWQIFTFSFLHGGGWHLFFNMLALWMFGPHVESLWGARRFFSYYVLCTFGAAMAQFLIAPTSLVVGASGGIYGILLAFGFLFPDAIMYLFFIFPVRAVQAVFFIALLTLASAIGGGGSRIAHFSHLGGMLAGFLYFKFPEWFGKYKLWRAERRFRNPLGRSERKKKLNDLSTEVDRILEKISSQGINSLTEQEHETMQRYAQRKK